MGNHGDLWLFVYGFPSLNGFTTGPPQPEARGAHRWRSLLRRRAGGRRGAEQRKQHRAAATAADGDGWSGVICFFGPNINLIFLCFFYGFSMVFLLWFNLVGGLEHELYFPIHVE